MVQMPRFIPIIEWLLLNFLPFFYMLWHCKIFLRSWNLLRTWKNWYWSVNKRNCLYFTCNYYFLLNAWFLFILMSIHDATSFTSPLNSFVSFFPQSSTWDADLIKEALHPNHQLITIPRIWPNSPSTETNACRNIGHLQYDSIINLIEMSLFSWKYHVSHLVKIFIWYGLRISDGVRISDGPHSAWSSIESTTILTMHSALCSKIYPGVSVKVVVQP